MLPVLCMITDGRHATAADDAALVQAVRAGVEAGAHLIQIREPKIEASRLARLVRACLEAVAGTKTRIVVNDRLDVALATGAHGVHLRESSVPPRAARAIVPRGFLVGRSVHTIEDASRLGREGSVDYLIFGAVFPTASKPGAPAAGLEALRLAVQVAAVPVLAIGGVNGSNAEAVAGTGAAGIAAIGWWSAAHQESLGNATQLLAAAFAAGAASRR